jgi:hypothetical protein
MSDIFTGTDLLGRVVRSDRKRAGRLASLPSEAALGDVIPFDNGRPSEEVMTGHSVIGEYDNLTDRQADRQTDKQTDTQVSEDAGGEGDNPQEVLEVFTTARDPRKRATREVAPADLLAGRVAEGRRMAGSPTATVTLRVPREFNAWLDEYIHRAWPERVHKQALVTEALQLLFARRGRPGEPVLSTELLPTTGKG